jgi:hypothetical protein
LTKSRESLFWGQLNPNEVLKETHFVLKNEVHTQDQRVLQFNLGASEFTFYNIPAYEKRSVRFLQPTTEKGPRTFLTQEFVFLPKKKIYDRKVYSIFDAMGDFGGI